LLYLPATAEHRTRLEWWRALVAGLGGDRPGDNAELAAKVVIAAAWDLSGEERALLLQALESKGNDAG
jgi:hypothetical protein